MKELWEIYVPTISNEGKPFRTKMHKEWDTRVRRISNGLTIYKPALGQWVDNETNELYVERVIPVRVACTKEEILKIMKITRDFYNQIDVLAYKLSSEVLFLKEEDV